MSLRYKVYIIVILLGISIGGIAELELNNVKFLTIGDRQWAYIPNGNTLYSMQYGEWFEIGKLSGLRPYLSFESWPTYILWQTYRMMANSLGYCEPYLSWSINLSLFLLIISMSIWNIGKYLLPLSIAVIYLSLAVFYAMWQIDIEKLYSMIKIYLLLPALLLSLAFNIYYFKLHRVPKITRWIQDFCKIDPDKSKKKSLDIHSAAPSYRASSKYNNLISKDSNDYLLGIWNDTDRPVSITEQQLCWHLHALGFSGAGKTSRVLIPLANQAINKGRGLIFIDWKAERQAINKFKELSNEKGKEFYYLSLTQNSHKTNLLDTGNPLQLADRLMVALDLVWEGPAQFYSMVQKSFLIDLITAYLKEAKAITIRDIYNILSDNNQFSTLLPSWSEDKKTLDQLRGLRASLAPLAAIDQLNSLTSDFSLKSIIDGNHTLYVHLSSQAYPQLAGTIGKLLCMSLETIAVNRSEKDTPFFLFLDEFQDCACAAQLNLLEKFRSSNLGLILSNQSSGQLTTPQLGGESYLQVIEDCTEIKIVFRRKNGKEAQKFAENTGTEPYSDRSTNLEHGRLPGGEINTKLDGKRSSSGKITTQYKQLVTPNELLSLPNGCALVTGVHDHLPGIASLPHPWSIDEKQRLESLPWPLEEKKEEVLNESEIIEPSVQSKSHFEEDYEG